MTVKELIEELQKDRGVLGPADRAADLRVPGSGEGEVHMEYGE